MKFFIDTADITEIKEANRRGWVDGVTTNPTLIARTGRSFKEVLKDICKEVKGPVSAELVSLEAENMLKEGRELARMADNIVIKIPMCEEGLIAVRRFSDEGIKTNVTLIFSANQAILAAKAGATYLSPFVGRLDDIAAEGMDVISQIIQIYNVYHFKTQVIVASVRHPLHVMNSALMGAHIVTIPFTVMKQLVKHPLTDKGIEQFLKDWEKVPKQ